MNNKLTTIALLSLALLPACEALRSTQDAEPQTVSLSASRWDVRYSINMPDHPTQDGDGWSLMIPEDKGEVDYVLCAHTAPLKGSVEMRLKVVADSGVVFDYLTESNNVVGEPASVRFILYQDMSDEFGRWWSNPARIILTPGKEATLRVSLDAKNWSSVNGKFANDSEAAKKGFLDVLANPVAVGMTFGGGSFFGHGVRARNGDATIEVTRFSVR